MKFRAKLLVILVIASLMNAIILESDRSFAGVDYLCGLYLDRINNPSRDDKDKKSILDRATDVAKFLPQTLRLARVPFIGRYKPIVEEAREIYNDLDQRGKAAQDEWKADFVKRIADKQPTKPEESLVYLRLITSPEFGQKIWEMYEGANLVAARRRLGINPFGLIAKFRKGSKPQLTEGEQYYLSEVVAQHRGLYNLYGAYLNKVEWPNRIANLDLHMLSLVRTAHNIADTKGSPIKGIIDFEQKFTSTNAMIEHYSGQIYLNYADRIAPEQMKYLNTTAFSEAMTSLMLEVEKGKLKRYEDEIGFVQFANDPDLIRRFIQTTVTPAEEKAFEKGGELAMLDQMRHDRGKREGFKEFRKFVYASTVFRALLLMIALMWLGKTARQMFGSRGGLMSVINPNAPAPSPTEQDNQEQIFEIFESGTFNPFELKGLFDDRPDPKNPSAPACPCDPDHAIRDKYAAKGFTNPHDVQLQDMEFLQWTNDQLLIYGPTHDSACAQRFVQAWEASYQDQSNDGLSDPYAPTTDSNTPLPVTPSQPATPTNNSPPTNTAPGILLDPDGN